MKKTDSEHDSSRGEWAYGRLKKEIESGTMAPGSRVRENEIAERLGISRTPVREALRRLESEGLVVHAPHQGSIIAELDHQAVIELYDMRETLEGTAARYAARHASEAEIQDLTELVESEQENAGDIAALAQLNRAFHAALYRAGHNRYLLKALLSLSDAMILLGGTTLAVPDRFPAAHAEHLAIIAAITERDPDRAEAAARTHIRNAQRARLKLLRLRLVGSASGDPGPGDF
ncbi:MAG TPA: GntR family transcriptional regulator [Azospirillum sp.]|nr:GntR family transcriptional regulator [Azospirillum sp.]